MRPTKLILSNWCQHRDLEIVLNPGMNMIQGPNGSGKSNIIDALGVSMSSDSSNTAGKSSKKTDNITIGSDNGKVSLEFDHRGTPGILTTYLKRNYEVDSDVLERERSAISQMLSDPEQAKDVTDRMLKIQGLTPRESFKRKLEWGGEVIEKKSEIDAWIQSAIGLPPAAIRARYFPTQGNIDSLISGSSEDRYKALAEQAQVMLCPAIYRKLGETIATRPDMSGVEEDYKESQLDLAGAYKDLEEAKHRLEEVEKKKVDPEKILSVIHSYQSADSSRARYAEYEQKMFDIKNEIKSSKEKLDSVTAQGKKLRVAYDNKVSKKELYDTVLSSYKEQSRILEARKSTLSTLKDVKEEYNSLVPVAKPDPSEKDEAYKSVTEVSVDKQYIKKKLDVFSSNQRCPTCGYFVEDVDALLRDAKKDIEVLEKKEKELAAAYEDKCSAYKKLHLEYEAYMSTKSRCESRMVALKESLDATPEPENKISKEECDEATLKLKDIEDTKQELDSLKSDYSTARMNYKELNNKLDFAKEILDQSKKDIDDSPTVEEFKVATKQYSDYQLYEQERNRADRELAQKDAIYEEAKRIAKDKEAKYKALDGERTWVGLLRSSRDLFHKNNLPREAILWYANRLIDVTSSYLKEFDNDFDIMMGDDMSFLAIKSSGDILPSYRLSGGQMNMLNLSIRFAYADLYPSEFQFLELDEVEVHLDNENVARLPAIFEKAKNLAKDKDLVVLFISHHPSLADLSDHVISL